MPVDPLDKPIAKLREETIDQLTLNYSHGELSFESFERRLDQALDAETHDALLSLTSDLDLVVDSAFREQKKREFNIIIDSHNVMEEEKIVSILGNSERQGAWNVPKEMRAFNILGKTVLDFSEAKFTSMITSINISCVLGNVIIYIPEGLNVVSKVSCILGDVKNKALSNNDADVPTIILDGFVLLGDIKIRLKKTFRERLLNFAENVRTMFAVPAK